MKLYHFTADQFLYGIRNEGITKGVFPLLKKNELIFIKDCQWLTKNSSYEQPWHDPEFSTLPYDRRRNRLTINIPKNQRHQLMDWKAIKFVFGDYIIKDFDFDDDCENWYIFKGRIKPSWIRLIEKRDAVPV
jgi:hypothetical protein